MIYITPKRGFASGQKHAKHVFLYINVEEIYKNVHYRSLAKNRSRPKGLDEVAFLLFFIKIIKISHSSVFIFQINIKTIIMFKSKMVFFENRAMRDFYYFVKIIKMQPQFRLSCANYGGCIFIIL